MTTASASAVDLIKSLRSVVISDARELGDVRRNAALFLARTSGDRRSSFERNLRLSLDATRFTEVPYLASIGYLIAAGVLLNPPTNNLRASLEKTVQRAAHTAERSGYADDALCACGLLLLARAVSSAATVSVIEEDLSGLLTSDAAMACVATVTLGRPIRTSVSFDRDSVEQVAAAVLLHRNNDGLARKLFLGLPADMEGHLLALLAKAEYTAAADLASMLLLAAMEGSFVVPDDQPPAADGSCDLGIVVALKEEFRILFDRIYDRHTPVEDGGRQYYIFDVVSVAGQRPHRCVATWVGEMGMSRTGVVTEKMLARWNPTVVAVVGIAGGIHKDVRLGDVIIASEVSNYVEGAKVVDGASGPSFDRASDSFKPKDMLLSRLRNFEFANRANFQKWEATCEKRCAALGVGVDSLKASGLLRARPNQLEGHVASGPTVVTSSSFATWIRGGDRACLCVEMESGGAMVTAQMDPSQRDVIVIRAISDLADDRKAALDGIGGGVLRRYAMENALDFLWGLIEAGVLPRNADHDSQESDGISPETIEESLLRVLHAHADDNGEVTTTWSEIRTWLGGTTADVHAAAIHLMNDGYFRSQTFDGGPYGTCNVVLHR